MRKLKKPQFIIIALAVFFVVLLLLLPRVENPVISKTENTEDRSAELRDPVESLEGQDRRIYEEINEHLSREDDPLERVNLFDSLSRFWESRNEIFEAARALSEIATILDDKASHFIAGDKFYLAFQNQKKEVGKKALQGAIDSYQWVLDKNPDDLEAMTSLGVCYVEGSELTREPPMKGITLLKKVLEIDPENVNALVNLGYFASKSGQFDLAIERFKTVIRIDPNYADAYLYLTDLYLKLKDRDNAVKQLEIFREMSSDIQVRKQLDEYIEKVKNNNI